MPSINETSTHVPATLDAINANFASDLADELCGAEPTEASDRRDTSPNGKLELLSDMLDMIDEQQSRARRALNRIERVVFKDSSKGVSRG